MASITFQNYFRLYERLSGMTGTADTEAYEFQEIYGLEVVVVPTHLPMVREDRGDYVFLTAAEKFAAVVEDARDCVARGQRCWSAPPRSRVRSISPACSPRRRSRIRC